MITVCCESLPHVPGHLSGAHPPESAIRRSRSPGRFLHLVKEDYLIGRRRTASVN